MSTAGPDLGSTPTETTAHAAARAGSWPMSGTNIYTPRLRPSEPSRLLESRRGGGTRNTGLMNR